MSIVFIDGFDVYPDINTTSQGVQSRWVLGPSFSGGENPSMVAGRFGGQGISLVGTFGNSSGAIGIPVAPSSVMAIGFAYNLQRGTPPITEILNLYSATAFAGLVAGIGVNASQQIFAWIGNATVQQQVQSGMISTGSWRYIEVVISASAMSVFLDGVNIIITGVIASPVNFVSLGAAGQSIGTPQWYDDFYLTNTSVRIGERRVETLNTASNGVVAWTPLANTNWQEVGEAICDGDASYVSTGTAGTSDFYAIKSLSSTPLIIDAVQVRCAVRKDDATSHILHTQIQSAPSGSGTVLAGADFAIAGTYLYDCDIHPTDPAGNPWSAATVNGAQIGQVLIS